VAFYLGVNVEYFEVGKPALALDQRTQALPPDPLNFGWRDYGTRVGIWRLMDLLDQVGMRATVLLNSDICAAQPEIVEAGCERDWVWLAHGRNNSILQDFPNEHEERAYLTEVVETIERATGARPKGWLGPALTETFDTPRLLAELGLTYVLDWGNDDQPYPLDVPGGRMISVPYSSEINDIRLFHYRNADGPGFERAVRDHFDTLYAEGRGAVFGIGLHPFLIAQPHRIRYLAQALDYVLAHEGVWVTTADEVADWYLDGRMAPGGIEPPRAASKAAALSAELRGPAATD
jgi:allantoinase